MPSQFFANAHSKPPTSPPLPRPQPPFNSRPNRQPTHPPPLIPPQPSAVDTPKSKQPANTPDQSLQPEPYPHVIAPGYSTPHPNITIETVSTAHIPSLTRITGLLLPIRYPNSFYTATVTDPVIGSLSRVAIYHDHHQQPAVPNATTPTNAAADKVIGGIRCRLERLPSTTAELLNSQSKSSQEPVNLYIQTLHLLSPYRGHGVATSLLNALLFESPASYGEKHGSRGDYQVSELVKHYNIRTVTAHVHEANDDALRWYLARGFSVEDGVVENYYKRLKPSGARIVRLYLRWNDRVRDTQQVASKDRSKSRDENEDEDWEKVEPEDADEHDHGVQPMSGSRVLGGEDGGRKKRKTSEVNG